MVDNELINIRQDEQIDLDKLKNYLNELLKIDIDIYSNISVCLCNTTMFS